MTREEKRHHQEVGSHKLSVHPRRQELIEKGKQAHFYGEPCDLLSRDDLLMMIGSIGEAREKDAKRWRHTRETLEDLTREGYEEPLPY